MKRKAITLILILLCIALFFSCKVLSQETPVPFFSLGAGNEGGIIQAGGFYDKAELQLQHKFPFSRRDIPTVTSLSLGIKIKDWITPLVGFARYSFTDFKKYENDPTGVSGFEYFSGFTPIVGLEVRHTWYFVKVDYCRTVFYSIGFKFHRKFKD